MPAPHPLLLDEPSTRKALSLDGDALAWLVATGQLTPVTVAGQRLYLVRQLEELVRVYRSKQVGANHES